VGGWCEEHFGGVFSSLMGGVWRRGRGSMCGWFGGYVFLL
jgi:hypothetical protein